jgi:hypothetical protein
LLTEEAIKLEPAAHRGSGVGVDVTQRATPMIGNRTGCPKPGMRDSAVA